jgi:hypothetical protein
VNGLDRRLKALEGTLGGRLVLRVFTTAAEADADSRPREPGVKVVSVVTGVPRSADGA